MIRLSKKMLLAVEAVVDIAYHARPEPVQSKEITRRQGVPQRYLEQVMQQLVHAGILRGVRGPRGGYRLARERRRINVGEIVRIVAELEQNEEPGGEAMSPLGEAVVRPVLETAMSELIEKLSAVTIEDLCQSAAQRGIERESAPRQDFAI